MAGGLVPAKAVAFLVGLEGSPVLAQLAARGRKVPFAVSVQPANIVDPITNASVPRYPSASWNGANVRRLYVDLCDGRAAETFAELNTLTGDEVATLYAPQPAVALWSGETLVSRDPSRHWYAVIWCLGGEKIGADGKLDPLPGATPCQLWVTPPDPS